jgi:hypothetical protein
MNSLPPVLATDDVEELRFFLRIWVFGFLLFTLLLG